MIRFLPCFIKNKTLSFVFRIPGLFPYSILPIQSFPLNSTYSILLIQFPPFNYSRSILSTQLPCSILPLQFSPLNFHNPILCILPLSSQLILLTPTIHPLRSFIIYFSLVQFFTAFFISNSPNSARIRLIQAYDYYCEAKELKG